MQSFSSCAARELFIAEDVLQYEAGLDPEVCVELTEKIYLLNAECELSLEPVDCG